MSKKNPETMKNEIIEIIDILTAKQLRLLHRFIKKLAGVESVHTRIITTWEGLHNGNDAV